jgi:hypothetical protein
MTGSSNNVPKEDTMTQPIPEEVFLRRKAQLQEQLGQYTNLQLWWVRATAQVRGGRHQLHANYLADNPDYRRVLIETLATDLAFDPKLLARVAGSDKHLTEKKLNETATKKGLSGDLISKIQASNPAGVVHSDVPLSTTAQLDQDAHAHAQQQLEQRLGGSSPNPTTSTPTSVSTWTASSPAAHTSPQPPGTSPRSPT